jgi:hypothetical protein
MSEDGTFGTLQIDGMDFCYTLELPDRDNASNISCIPAGEYNIRPYSSERFGRTYIVKEVSGRSGILFHAGNTIADTKGCILLGETLGKLKGDRAVLNSGVTFKRFLSVMNWDDATLSINNT